MRSFFLIGLGGALGTLARYGLGQLVMRIWTGALPLWTWAANLTGCLLIGVAVAVLGAEARDARLFAVVGFLGAFTTFSTFSLETVRLLERGLVGHALVNAVGAVVLGLACVWLGLRIGAWVGVAS